MIKIIIIIRAATLVSIMSAVGTYSVSDIFIFLKTRSFVKNYLLIYRSSILV